jgi:hypothetical protein
MILNSPYITGSLTVTGNTTLQGALTVTGSLSGIASTASFALTLGGTGSVGFATTGAFAATSGSASSRLTQIEQVYATTGSNSFRATQSITGSLTVTGQIIAQTLNVQQVTSSIVFSSGSNVFGCDLNSRQTFTGSVLMTGSLIVNTTGPELQVNNNGVILGNLLTDNHSITGSLRITGSATFASTVTAGGNFTAIADGGAGGLRLTLNNTGAGEVQYVVLTGGSAGTGFFGIRNGSAGTNLFLMNGCGATTFASCISATSAIFSSRLGVGISSDQTYASLFVGGDITTGANQYAILADPQLSGTSNSYAIFANARIKANTAVTNAFGVYIPSAEKISGATITNNYALYIANQTSGATLNYSIYSSGGLNYFGGNVGIGTTTPTALLQVRGPNAAGIFFDAQNDGAGGATFNRINASSFPFNQYTFLNGHLGIGTTSPSYTLHAQAPSNSIAAYFRAGGTSGFASIAFSGEAGTAVGVFAATSTCIFFGRANGTIGNQFGSEGDIMINCANGNVRMNNSLTVLGALSKGSGSFRICHPLASKKCTHQLVHSFIEGPQADLIYSGRTVLQNGISCINMDCVSRMTEGTFLALNRCLRVFTTNETSWDQVKGRVIGNILIVESQNTESNDEISWMVIGERQDEHMLETEWTDEQGRVITEPEIVE